MTTGTITGNIKDAQRGVIPGATVTLVSATRGTTLATGGTNTDGDYVFPNVPPDTYLVRVTMDGFKTIERSGITVSPGDRVALPTLTIEVGGLDETVTVAGESPLIQSRTGERSFTVATDAVQNLPISNRSFTSLTSLAPGVDVSGNNPGRLGGGGSNNTLMDGVSTVDTGNNQPVLFLNLEAIAEVKVLTSGYQAEYGKASGIQITAVTKSGTNQFRGSVYDVRRNSDWNSNSWVNIKNGNAKAVNKEDDWGYSIGGPIGKPGGTQQAVLLLQPGVEAAHDRRRPQPVPLPDRARARRRLLADARQQRQPLQPDSRRLDQPAVHGDHHAPAVSRTAASSAGFRRTRLYQTGLNILRQYPMPNIDGTGPALQLRGAGAADQDAQQPAGGPASTISRSSRCARSSATRPRCSGSEVFPGSIPGFNDVQTQNPIIATIAASVNYTINPTTFLEVTYGRIQNELAGCTTLNGVCANAVPMGEPSNKNNVGLGDLPLIFPDGLGMDSRYYEYKTLERMAPPFWQNGQIMLPPTFTWGNRIGNAPPNIAYPAWLNLNRTHRRLAQPDEGLGPAHAQDRLLQPLQLQGAEPRHRRLELRRPRRDELRQQHQQPDRLGVRLRQRGARASSTPTRRCRGSWKAASSTTTARATSRTTGRSTAS